MLKHLFVPVAAAMLACSTPVLAQDHTGHMEHMDHMHHHHHQMAADGDNRQAVNFPPEMRQQLLAEMRSHLQALSDILTAMSAGQYAQAAQIADTRMGMASASAEGCTAEGNAATPQMSKPGEMSHPMAQFMPEEMRKTGQAMHQAASDFAAAARKTRKGSNPGPALAVLSRMTQQCASCHAAFKLQ